MPLGESQQTRVRRRPQAPKPPETEVTNAIPRIESALPSEPATINTSLEDAHLPHMRSVLLAAFGALVVVGGLSLALAHPWDPDAYSTRATEEADTSLAGFPGEISHLSGQDKRTDEDEEEVELSGDEKSYSELSSSYEQLGEVAKELQENEDLFFEVAFGSDDEQVEEGKAEAEAIALELSNLIDKIAQVDTSSGTYTETVSNLTTLGNWLRNRSDAQCEAWNRALASSDRAGDRPSIEAPIINGRNPDGNNAYAVLFEDSYEGWKPQKP